MRKNIRYLILILSAILVLALGACELIPAFTPQTSPAATTPATMPPSTEVASTSTPTPINPTWTTPLQNQNPVLPSIADVVDKVRPSVVTINVVATDRFGRSVEGAGSGWVIDSKGIIVTNNHVVEGASTVTVTLADGQSFTADPSRISTDALNDLAVVKIDVSGLTAVQVDTGGRMRVGDWVVAIGNSLGQGISATNGIVSAMNVSLAVSEGESLENLIQTNAAINPGNSGGPLVNMSGQVIGITSAKIASVGVEGMGYAISITTAMPILQQLISKGYVIRPYLGVTVETVNAFLILRYRLAIQQGAFIDGVGQGSPADRVGLKTADVITSFNGRDITTSEGLLSAIHSSQIGQSVDIVYWRGNSKQTVSVTLIESPPPG